MVKVVQMLGTLIKGRILVELVVLLLLVVVVVDHGAFVINQFLIAPFSY